MHALRRFIVAAVFTLFSVTPSFGGAEPTPKLTLKGHGGGASCLAFSPDGKLLAVGTGEGTVKIWNVNDTAGQCPAGAEGRSKTAG